MRPPDKLVASNCMIKLNETIDFSCPVYLLPVLSQHPAPSVLAAEIENDNVVTFTTVSHM